MEVKTMTSVYELTKGDNGYTLIKKAVAEGKESLVDAGEKFEGRTAYLQPISNCLVVGSLRTSTVQNALEVFEFLNPED